MTARERELEAAIRTALDALDAEKEPNYERGYDRAVRVLNAAVGQGDPSAAYRGADVPLREIP